MQSIKGAIALLSEVVPCRAENNETSAFVLGSETVVSSAGKRTRPCVQSGSKRGMWRNLATLLNLSAITAIVAGCGTGGYAGVGITNVSRSAITIDAGQSIPVTATATGTTVNWSMSGCSGSSCGSLSATTGATVNYVAPKTLTSPITLSLQANVAGTQNSKVVAVTVNPAPTIIGDSAPGTVGQSWSMSLSSSGGTAPVKFSFGAIALPDGLSLNAATGTISGTPTVAGTWTIPVQITDSSDVPFTVIVNKTVTVSAGQAAQISVNGNPIAGTVGAAYSSAISAVGGVGPYTYSTVFGALPSGLSLSANGAISGTPTVAGTFVFVAQAQDANGLKGTGSFVITVAPQALSILASKLPDGSVGAAYSALLGISGGTGPYTCSVASGALPAGLSFGAGCVISGVPTVAATSALMVKVSDASIPSLSVTGALSITIAPAPLSLSIGSLPNGTLGTVYSATLGVSGGTAPYSCSITSGALPTGLAFGAGCSVVGIPTVASTANFIVKVTDASTPLLSTSGAFSITISPVALSLVSGLLPGGTVNTAYSAVIGVAGGTGPYSCVVTAGSLPAGLSLGAGCSVNGTPTAAGTANFIVKVVDSSNPTLTTSGPMSITIAPAALVLVTLTLPDGVVGTPYLSPLGITGGTGLYSCSTDAGVLPAGLTLGAGCVVSGTPTTAGKVSVTVKITDTNPLLPAITGVVQINIVPAPLALITGTLPSGTVGNPYSATIGVAGGTSPYGCALVSGMLPAGLTLGAGCTVSGTPTAAGAANLVVKVTDASSPTLTLNANVSLTIAPAGLAITAGSLPNGVVHTAYSATIGVSGGTSPYSCVITSGSLPAGLTLGAGCVVSGTPTTTGTSNVTVKVIDSSSPVLSTSGPVSITIANAPLVLATLTLPIGVVDVPYLNTLGITGGTGAYACSLVSGSLPAGLSFGANCNIVGTPTVAGTVSLTVKIEDKNDPSLSLTVTLKLTITPAPLVILTNVLPSGTVGTAYNQTIGIDGGTSPYICSISLGALPAGLNLSSSCVVSGSPTTVGTALPLIKVVDSSNPQLSYVGLVSITIAPSQLLVTTPLLANGTVGTVYSQTVGVTGGTAPYSCSIAAGSLPAGLSLDASCVVSGTPTLAETQLPVIRVTDASNPQLSYVGPISVTVLPALPVLTLTSPTVATVDTAYTSTIGVNGGTAPYTCSLTLGTMPAGLTLNNDCSIVGTPTTAGTTLLTVHATDSSNPQAATTGIVTVVVSAAPVTLTLTSPAPATLGSAYLGNIGVSGGTAPYFCSLVSGTIPGGLTLNNDCTIAGIPTVQGTAIILVTVTDSSLPTSSTTGPVTIRVDAASANLTLSAPPAGTTGVAYIGSVGVTGGTGPYSCVLMTGSLPSGLTLANNCSLTGTPTTSGTATITVKATDSNVISPTTVTGPITITINPGTLTLAGPMNAATVGTAYTGTINVRGGVAPYNCSLASGALPTGLALNSDCSITGTPTASGTATISVTATDAENPIATITASISLTVNAAPTLTLNGSVPNATVGVAYAQTLHATGGVAPYRYALTAGNLPAGLSMSSMGEISGTPTAPGASSFTITATDSQGTPQTASLPLLLLVVYPTTPNDTLLDGPYAFLFQGYDDAVLGVLSYQTASVGSFTADGTGVVSNGELDANHQFSLAAGNTISSNAFVGTYTVGNDDRGSLTITTLNTNGTTAQTSTYAIAVKAPVGAATVSAGGSLIEFDNDHLQGTKGSGSFMQQTPTSFGDGLRGNYAFGLQGDTPCLPSCGIGIIAGPAAAVGQFHADGAGSVTSGTEDANVATANIANSALSGSYGSADGNGRVQLALNASGTLSGVYPTDYAVYMVNANTAFVMSTDKHSQYILLAGSANLQTQSTFSNASLNGSYVGYENAPTNPGLVGTVLQNVLNLTTSAIFHGTANGAGTCNTDHVDVGGTTGLVNGLTGVGSGVPVLNALLGTYQSTGNSACTVAANGRAELNYPVPSNVLTVTLGLLHLAATPPAKRVAYLYAPNQGYFLETGYAGLGSLEAQIGSPFSTATLNGNYVYLTSPASSVVSTNTAGIFKADGAGNINTAYDLNVGVGTLNLLQLGVTGTFNYGLTDATVGRYLLGTSTVVYAITPERFVLLDTNATTTSPSVALLY